MFEIVGNIVLHCVHRKPCVSPQGFKGNGVVNMNKNLQVGIMERNHMKTNIAGINERFHASTLADSALPALVHCASPSGVNQHVALHI